MSFGKVLVDFRYVILLQSRVSAKRVDMILEDDCSKTVDEVSQMSAEIFPFSRRRREAFYLIGVSSDSQESIIVINKSSETMI